MQQASPVIQHRRKSCRVAGLLAAGLVLAWAQPTRAQQGLAIRPGEVVDRIVSASDTTQSYALYVPAAYVDSLQWPILFLMDPRGRALVPLWLFRAAAERNGWILFSSWNTLSDGPAEPNVFAMNAMLGDALASFAIDRDRLYLGGFSGTARVAWDFAAQLNGTVAGIFGASAGTNPRQNLFDRAPAELAFFGTAGELDFNHDEVVRFRGRLEAWRLPHRLRVFRGGHQWPGDSLAAAAVDWFDLQAMRRGLLPVDAGRVARLHEADSVAAAPLEAAGDWLAAFERQREIAADYAGLRDVSAVEARVRELAEDRRVKRAAERRDRLIEENGRRDRRLFEYLDRVPRMATPPRSRDVLAELDVARLRRLAAGNDTVEARSAGRALEQIFVTASFYGPRDLISRGQPSHALALLEVAAAIKPDHPQVLLQRARALARAGADTEARAALEAALRAGVDSSTIAADSGLARLLGR